MTRLVVKRESLGINTRHTSPSYLDGNDEQILVSSDCGLPTASTFQANINQGAAYSTGYAHLSGNLLGAGDSLDIVFAFGSGVEPMMTIEGICGGNAEGYMYEGATATGGTSLSSVNLNRVSTNTSNSAFLLNPTVSATGTLLGAYALIGGQYTRSAGADMHSAGFVMKSLTNYLLRLTNTSSLSQKAMITINWYE